MGAREVSVFFLLAIAGCGGRSAVERGPSFPACETRVAATNPSDTVTVVLFDTVDLAHAPWGRNREERFVFSHLYETLVTIDCAGVVRPGLAKSWLPGSDGWLVELRDDAHFWDETPVTAHDVVASFEPAIRDGIAIQSVDVVDERSLILHGYRGRPDLKLLTLPMLAVRKERGGPPMGTGEWMIDEDVAVEEAVVIRPVLAEGPVVRFVRGNVSDARDLMDGAADAMITDDPAAIEYARERKGTALAPLAWDRAYVLIAYYRAKYLAGGDSRPGLPASLCDALARDAVRVDARGGSSFLIDSEAACDRRAGDGRADPGGDWQPRIVYKRTDETAGGLAERIVALAAMDSTLPRAIPGLQPGIRAVGIAASEFDASLRQNGNFGHVVSLSWCADFPFVVYRFRERAPWLFGRNPQALSRTVLPLVETRAHFVAISDRIGFADDHRGGVRVMISKPEVRR